MSSDDADVNSDFLARVYSPALNWHPPRSSPDRYEKSVEYFHSVEWTKELLSKPDTYTYLPHSRNSGQAVQEQLFSSTFNSEDTIAFMLGTFQASKATLRDPEVPIKKISLLLHLGHGLSGVPTNLHGGVTMAILDEAMGQAIEVNTALKKSGSSFNGSSVTGTLETKFRKLIPTGTVIKTEATLERVEGRKTFVTCKVTDEDGNLLAEGRSIWVCLRPNM